MVVVVLQTIPRPEKVLSAQDNARFSCLCIVALSLSEYFFCQVHTWNSPGCLAFALLPCLYLENFYTSRLHNPWEECWNICNIGNKMIIATLRKMVAVKVTTCQTLCNLLKMTRQEVGKTTVYKGCQTLLQMFDIDVNVRAFLSGSIVSNTT